MKPVIINLSKYVNIKGKVFAVCTAVLLLITTILTVATGYDYIANRRLIKDYRVKVNELKKRAENKEQEKIIKEFSSLLPLIKRDLFPLPALLTELEKNKPNRINIHELLFSEDLRKITIKGESAFVESVSEFLMQMKKSKHFSIKLIKEVIQEDRSILFELKADWYEDEKN